MHALIVAGAMDDVKLGSLDLQFDFNGCTVRDFCEVFQIDHATARYLFEYRLESMHVFKFQQLLKLKGVTEESLQTWCFPKSAVEPDAALQKSLQLEPDKLAPLSKLLESASKVSEATGCLLTTRMGHKILQFPETETIFEKLAAEVPEFMNVTQDDLLELKTRPANMQVTQFEANELLFAPAGALYLTALLSPGKINPSSLKLWQSVASEVRRRYPPKVFINNHAVVTENDVAFDCPQCHLRIVIDKAGIDMNIHCPRCKVRLTVPQETTSISSFKTPEQLAAGA